MGEILAREARMSFSGYRNLPEQTAQAFTRDGWFRTGDIGYFDDDNFFTVLGRLSTLIKTESGEKVQTEDVESAYAKEPAIREIGVLKKGGKLVALIVPERAACGRRRRRRRARRDRDRFARSAELRAYFRLRHHARCAAAHAFRQNPAPPFGATIRDSEKRRHKSCRGPVSDAARGNVGRRSRPF